MFNITKNKFYDIFSEKAILRNDIKLPNIKCYERQDVNKNVKRLTVFRFIQFVDDKSVIVWAIPEIFNIIINHIKLFQDDLFSDKSVDCLYNNLFEIAKSEQWNIEPERMKNYVYVTYGINDKNKLNISKKQDTTIKFYSNTPYKVLNIGDFDVKKYDSKVFYYGTLIDNNIVSVARYGLHICENPDLLNESVDIDIDTNEDYRQRGYAVSNVIALTEHLLSGEKEVANVKEVTYQTSNYNIESQKTALSAGFKEIAKEKSFSHYTI